MHISVCCVPSVVMVMTVAVVTEVEKELEKSCDGNSVPPPLPLTPAPSAPSLLSRSKGATAYPSPGDRADALQDSRIAAGILSCDAVCVL